MARTACTPWAARLFERAPCDTANPSHQRPPEPASGLRERARREVRKLCRELREWRVLSAHNDWQARNRRRSNGCRPQMVWSPVLQWALIELEAELRGALEIARRGVPSWAEIDEGIERVEENRRSGYHMPKTGALRRGSRSA